MEIRTELPEKVNEDLPTILQTIGENVKCLLSKDDFSIVTEFNV